LNELVKTFEGQEVKITTDKGVKLINLVHTAKCCGLINRTRNFESVRWSQVKEKLKVIHSIGRDMPIQYLEEIQYILDEIENSDDRNSIYMSTWLTKRLSIECHSDKAMRYKNFLVTLDEKRENNEIMNSMEALNVISNSLPAFEQLVAALVPAMNHVNEKVSSMQKLMYDQATIYEQEREELKELIGIRSRNTKRLSDLLKNVLSNKYERNISASSSIYEKAKNKIFREFKVDKWEDIPASRYNSVYAFIEEGI
jgi:hypothetical protein